MLNWRNAQVLRTDLVTNGHADTKLKHAVLSVANPRQTDLFLGPTWEANLPAHFLRAQFCSTRI